MAKAINWPFKYYEEITMESVNSPKIALRPGCLYYDNNYYRDGDKVDIRVQHRVVRPAVIQGKMKLKRIKDLTQEEIKACKSDLNNIPAIILFLNENYELSLDENSEVTVITYRNLMIINSENIDDITVC